MTYMTFILTLENIINTSKTKPEENGLQKALDTVNDMINNGVHAKTILECNIPKLRITYDYLSSQYYCHPANVQTTYMSLTVGYYLNNTEHYNRFTTLTSSEPQFVKDLEQKYKSAIIRADLRAMKEFPGLKYYVDVFGLPKYNEKNFRDIIGTLEYELSSSTKNRNISFETFQSGVYMIIERIDTLYGMTGGSFDADGAWKYIFDRDLRTRGFLNFPTRCDTKKFRDLYHIYEPQNIEKRKTSKYTYKKQEQKQYSPPPVKKPQKTEKDEFLSFMGLSISYNGKQLKKKFRKLAVKYHPDKSGGDSEKFLYLKKCYEALQKGL